MNQENKTETKTDTKTFYIGHHINTSHGFITCADHANTTGANFFQIFLASPHQYNGKRHSEKDILELANKVKKYGMKVVVHANFMLNFCNPPDSFKHKSAVKLLIDDLNESVKLGAIGVVIHMGKQLDMEEGVAIANYVKGVKTALEKSPKDSIIILETGAGQGSEVCTSMFGLNRLYNMFTKEEKKRIKFCIDTCHIFAAGYNIGDEQYVDVYVGLIDALLGWDKVACIHFNDSECPINSRKDRHADIGNGLIKVDGLKKFFLICCEKGIPVVLETPCKNNCNSKDQVSLLKSWILNKDN